MKRKLISSLIMLNVTASTRSTLLSPVHNTSVIQAVQQVELNKALSKKIKDHTCDEALLAKNYYKNKNDYEMAIKCAERILATAPYSDKPEHADLLCVTLFELVKFCFEQKNIEKTQKYALEYQTLYLATPECKEVVYYGIRAHFAATLSPDRDQSHTQKTLEYAQEFIKRYPDDVDYSAPIKSIIATCYTKLLESELQIIQSYLNRYRRIQKPALLTAAQKRVEYIQEKLLPLIPAQKDQVIRIQEQIAQATNPTRPTLKHALHHKQTLQPEIHLTVAPVGSTLALTNKEKA